MEKEIFVADDRGIIPDEIKKLSPEELDEGIARLEAELIAKRQQQLYIKKNQGK